MHLLDLAEDTPHSIRGLGKPGRRCEEDDYSAALVSNCPGSQEKNHHTHIRGCHVPVSHCGTFRLFGNAARNLVAGDTDLTDNTGPAGGTDLYLAMQI